jgi:hypothetical protein
VAGQHLSQVSVQERQLTLPGDKTRSLNFTGVLLQETGELQGWHRLHKRNRRRG